MNQEWEDQGAGPVTHWCPGWPGGRRRPTGGRRRPTGGRRPEPAGPAGTRGWPGRSEEQMRLAQTD